MYTGDDLFVQVPHDGVHDGILVLLRDTEAYLVFQSEPTNLVTTGLQVACGTT
jgi:hypothetical protein